MEGSSSTVDNIDLVAHRLSDLGLRHRNFVSNPQRCQTLSSQCTDFKYILLNTSTKLEHSNSLDPEKEYQLNVYLRLTASVFTKAQQDLTVLVNSFSNLMPNTSQNHFASSSSNPAPPTSSVRSSRMIVTVQDQLTNPTLHPPSTVKDMSRVKRDTEILDTIENHISNKKQYPLHILNFLYLVQGKGIRSGDDNLDVKKITGRSGFERHFDKLLMPANCVVDFRLYEEGNGFDAVQSHEARLKLQVIHFVSAYQGP